MLCKRAEGTKVPKSMEMLRVMVMPSMEMMITSRGGAALNVKVAGGIAGEVKHILYIEYILKACPNLGNSAAIDEWYSIA